MSNPRKPEDPLDPVLTGRGVFPPQSAFTGTVFKLQPAPKGKVRTLLPPAEIFSNAEKEMMKKEKQEKNKKSHSSSADHPIKAEVDLPSHVDNLTSSSGKRAAGTEAGSTSHDDSPFKRRKSSGCQKCASDESTDVGIWVMYLPSDGKGRDFDFLNRICEHRLANLHDFAAAMLESAKRDLSTNEAEYADLKMQYRQATRRFPISNPSETREAPAGLVRPSPCELPTDDVDQLVMLRMETSESIIDPAHVANSTLRYVYNLIGPDTPLHCQYDLRDLLKKVFDAGCDFEAANRLNATEFNQGLEEGIKRGLLMGWNAALQVVQQINPEKTTSTELKMSIAKMCDGKDKIVKKVAKMEAMVDHLKVLLKNARWQRA